MSQYIAFVWDPSDASQHATVRLLAERVTALAPDWKETFSCSGLRVFCRHARSCASKAYLLDANGGVVLGTAFENTLASSSDDVPHEATFGAAATKSIRLNAGRDLVTDYWGRYVAFVTDEATRKIWVLRNATGGIPCFGTRFHGVTILFSAISDCLRLNLLRFSISWQHLAVRVAAGPVRLPDTALQEVFCVDRGECLEFSSTGMTRRRYWDPRSIVQGDAIEDAREAAILLRATTRACVRAWAACYRSIVLRLSGGLDSSIILGCLNDMAARPTITGHVYYIPHAAASDERPFAALAAAKARCELVERDRTTLTLRLEDLLHAAPAAFPAQHLAYLESGACDMQLARSRQASAIFAGDGGDALFGRHVCELAATDYAQRHGVRTDLLRLATRLAPTSSASVWTLLGRAIRDGVLSRKLDPTDGAFAPRQLVSSAVRDPITHDRAYLHAWFQPLPGVPPGKLLQLRYMLGGERWIRDPFAPDNAPEEIYPLQAQPLVELALRIPTDVLVNDGRPRGLARAAFTPDVPAEILARGWKGRPGNIAQMSLMQNMKFVRELLLDGYLVKNQLLDRRTLEAALAGPSRLAGGVLEVFDHVIVECWVRQWLERMSQLEAA